MSNKTHFTPPRRVDNDAALELIGHTVRYRESKFIPLTVLFAAAAYFSAARKNKRGVLISALIALVGIPAGFLFAYSAPSTLTTGDLVTAAIWNQDVVDNVIFLHSRSAAIYINGYDSSNAANHTSTITVTGQYITAANKQHFYFRVPADFASIAGLQWVYSPFGGGTSDVDYSVGYGASGEVFDADNATVAGAGGAVTQDHVELLDLSAGFGSLAANDYISVRIAYGGTGPNLFDMGMWFEYTRT